MALLLALLGLAAPAQAQFATGGQGIYRNNILWIDWGTNNANIPQAGTSVTNTINVAGQTLQVTCTLSAISGSGPNPDLRIYRPGGYREDALEELYNIGGIDTANTMDIGLVTRSFGSDATFTYACSATLGGVAYPLDGLVFADAETTNQSELIRMTSPAGASIRVLERFREPGCTTGYNVNVTGTQYTFSTLPPNTCTSASSIDDAAPIGVFFIDNASSATIYIASANTGLQGIALGVFLNAADYGDAPAGYGVAGHLAQMSWTGGTLTAGDTNIFGTGFGLASLTVPGTARLGARVDTEPSSLHTANASGDNLDNQADEDGVASIPLLSVVHAGSSYSVPVACAGNSPIAGWIDFNRNGSFQASERSAATCSAGSATLTWTVPSLPGVVAGASFLRVRTADSATDIANPTGLAATGETEDHALTIESGATLRIQKTRVGNVGGPVAFNFTGDGPGTGTPGDDTFAFTLPNSSSQTHDYGTANANTATPGTSLLNNLVAGTYAVTESFTDGSNNDFELTNVTCVNQAGGASGSSVSFTTAANGGSATITLVAGANYLCTFTNTRDPNITLIKAVQGVGATFPFTVGATGSGTITPATPSLAPADNGTAQANIEVQLPGGGARDITITEGALPAGYTLTNASCTKVTTAANGTTTSTTYNANLATRAVTILAFGVDDTATCTFTNAQQGSIVIIKDAVPNSPQDFAFTTVGTGLSGFSLDDDDSADTTLSYFRTFTGLAPGSYSVTETALAGWSLTGLSCVDPTGNSTGSTGTRSASIDLAAGEMVRCTFTNTLTTDISVGKTATPNPVLAGGLIEYTLLVRNLGLGDVANVPLTDTPGASLDCLTPSPTATCTASAGAICPGSATPGAGSTVSIAALLGSGLVIPSLPAGQQVSVTLQCRVNASGF